MGLSDTAHSGRSSGGRSNFSQTCSLLSRYLKEKGSFPDLKLGLTSSLEPKGAPASTVNLIAAVRNETQKKSEANSAPMTIFYDGQVIVFDDFPADKAKQIMMLASKSSGGGSGGQYKHDAAFAPPVAAQCQAESTTGIQNNITTFGIHCHQALPSQADLGSDLPIARKKSLARFLEKRNDSKNTANSPYQASKPRAAAAPKPAKGEAWLGMAPQGH